MRNKPRFLQKGCNGEILNQLTKPPVNISPGNYLSKPTVNVGNSIGLKMKTTASFIATALLLAFASPASAVVINASGEGWCNSSGACNNTNTSTAANTFAGVITPGGVSYRDWFYFNVPVGNYVSAVLSISNNASNVTNQASSVFTLSAASGINYAGLGSGTALGSITAGAANTGVTHYVNITLNGSALSLLNTSAGGGFLFGGSLNGTNTSTNQLFGYTNGTPLATLTLTSATPVSAIPETQTWLLMVAGFAGLGGLLRRKQPKARLRVTYT
jgi:hypothetical protein